MQVNHFSDGETNCETWELPDSGWNDWVKNLDPFLSHAIRRISAEYVNEPVEWLEINTWPSSGRIIVFPSQEGPEGERDERVRTELASDHLENESNRISESVPDDDQDVAWEALTSRVWQQISDCLTKGEAAQELTRARESRALRIVGYDYNAGEGPIRLGEDGELN